MKRLLLVLLVVAMALPCTALALEGKGFLRGAEGVRVPGQHLLWNILFGTPADEVVAMVKEHTGLTLAPGISQWGESALVTPAEVPVELWGYPVRISFILDGEESLRMVVIQFSESDEKSMLQMLCPGAVYMQTDMSDMLDDYRTVHQGLHARYGDADGGVLAVEGSGGMRFFDYPGGAQGLDYARLAKAALDTDVVGFVTKYNNIYEMAVITVEKDDDDYWAGSSVMEMQAMLFILEDEADLAELDVGISKVEGFTTENGEYQGEALKLEL